VWTLPSAEELAMQLDKVREYFGYPLPSNSILKHKTIHLYEGKESVSDLMKQIFTTHKNEFCIGIQSDIVYKDWKKVLGLSTINNLNKNIKKNKLIIQAILPKGHFTRGIDTMGSEWARHFEGRTYRANEIDEQYFKHHAELFLFKKSLYLICLRDELVLEIKHPEIQKMMLLLINFIQDNSRLLDGNEIIRNILMIKNNS
jgi:hypothetical protein